MKYALGIIGFLGIINGLITYDFKSKSLQNFRNYYIRLFRIHCRKVLISEYKYALQSVLTILGVSLLPLLLISLLIIFIAGESSPFYTSISTEIGIVVLFLIFGHKDGKELKEDFKELFKKKAIMGLKMLSVFCLIILCISYSIGSISIKEIIIGNSVLIISYAWLCLSLFFIFGLAPFSILFVITIIYKWLIKKSYNQDFENPLPHFFRYYTILVFFLTILYGIFDLYLS